MAGVMKLIWVKREAEYFFRKGWTTQITLIGLNKSGCARKRPSGYRLPDRATPRLGSINSRSREYWFWFRGDDSRKPDGRAKKPFLLHREDGRTSWARMLAALIDNGV
jgi:hypothetical protein